MSAQSTSENKNSIERELDALSDHKRALTNAWYFKSGPGEYGEGDKFIGLTVPNTRAAAKKYWQLPYGDVLRLLRSEIHEYRLCALMILVYHFEKEIEERKRIYELVLENTSYINNWDLVDTSAPYIVGEYLQEKPRRKLYELARSKNLWERRIAIVATSAFIKKHQFADTLAISEILLADEQDLIHKATGWMLREVGKRDKKALTTFLTKHARNMPRTALRYAIEKFPEKERKDWLAVGKGKAEVKKLYVPLPKMHR